MNVLNMFQEDELKLKLVKPEPLEVPPIYEFPQQQPEVVKGQIIQPPMYQPEIPTNMEQAQQAIIGETPQFNAELSQAPIPEPTRQDRIKADMDGYMKEGINPMFALIDQGTPQLDEQKAKRLKFASATNALGQGLATLFGGVMGAKGGPILEQKNEYSPAALAEYNQMIAADKDAKYRNAMAKSQYVGQLFQMANNNVNAEDQRDFSREVQKNSQDFQALQRQLDRDSAKENATMRSGLSFEERNALIEKEGQMKLDLRNATTSGMLQLEQLRTANAISKKDYDLQMKKLFEDYKAGMEKITKETTGYEDGKETKTKVETTKNPQTVTKPQAPVSSDPDDEFLAK